MRAERRPGNERPEQEGAREEPKEAKVFVGGEGWGCYSAEAQSRKPSWQGKDRGSRASAGGQSCSCIIFVSSLNKCL